MHLFADKKSGGWLWSIFMFLMGLSLMTFGFGVSLLWIYTGGHLDQRSIERALPVIQKDMDLALDSTYKKANVYLDSARQVKTDIIKLQWVKIRFLLMPRFCQNSLRNPVPWCVHAILFTSRNLAETWEPNCRRPSDFLLFFDNFNT